MYGVGRVLVQGHKSTREVHFANWIVPPLSASNDSEASSGSAAAAAKTFLCCSFSEYAIW